MVLDIETGYKSHLKGATVLRPFIGLGMGYTRTESFNEHDADGVNLHVENNDYLRTEVRIGANLNNGKKNRFNWYAEAAGKVLLTGDKGEYRAQFRGTQKDMKIRGSKQGKAHISLGAGAEYEIAENISLYVNLRAQASNTSNGYYGNSGISFRF